MQQGAMLIGTSASLPLSTGQSIRSAGCSQTLLTVSRSSDFAFPHSSTPLLPVLVPWKTPRVVLSRLVGERHALSNLCHILLPDSHETESSSVYFHLGGTFLGLWTGVSFFQVCPPTGFGRMACGHRDHLLGSLTCYILLFESL